MKMKQRSESADLEDWSRAATSSHQKQEEARKRFSPPLWGKPGSANPLILDQVILILNFRPPEP